MKIKLLIPLSLIGLIFASCSSTKLEKSWADPSFNAATTEPFKKVLIFAPLKDAASQRTAEDKIAAQFKDKSAAVPSYTYLQPSDTNQIILDQKLKKDGFDGVISMQLKEVEKSTSYVQGTTYGGYYGYRGYYGYGAYSPGYYTEDKTYFVETNLYSLRDSKLLWSGTTSSMNPSKFDSTVDQIIYTVNNELKKKGFMKK